MNPLLIRSRSFPQEEPSQPQRDLTRPSLRLTALIAPSARFRPAGTVGNSQRSMNGNSTPRESIRSRAKVEPREYAETF